MILDKKRDRGCMIVCETDTRSLEYVSLLDAAIVTEFPEIDCQAFAQRAMSLNANTSGLWFVVVEVYEENKDFLPEIADWAERWFAHRMARVPVKRDAAGGLVLSKAEAFEVFHLALALEARMTYPACLLTTLSRKLITSLLLTRYRVTGTTNEEIAKNAKALARRWCRKHCINVKTGQPLMKPEAP